MYSYKKFKKLKKKENKKPMKFVRIDHKTEIEVSIDIPDEVARKEYQEKLDQGMSEQHKRMPRGTP